MLDSTVCSFRLPKGVGTGWYLSGAMTLPKDEGGKKVSQYSINYVLVDPPRKSSRAVSSSSGGGSSSSAKAERNKKKLFDGKRMPIVS